MNRVAIICNVPSHAKFLIFEQYNVSSNNAVIIADEPNNNHRFYGYKDLPYYCIRPMKAKELAYARSHNWREVSIEEAVKILATK